MNYRVSCIIKSTDFLVQIKDSTSQACNLYPYSGETKSSKQVWKANSEALLV